jgi:hypothetical protein
MSGWENTTIGIPESVDDKLTEIVNTLDFKEATHAYKMCFSLQYLATNFEKLSLDDKKGERKTKWAIGSFDPDSAILKIILSSVIEPDHKKKPMAVLQLIAEEGIEKVSCLVSNNRAFSVKELIDQWDIEFHGN